MGSRFEKALVLGAVAGALLAAPLLAGPVKHVGTTSAKAGEAMSETQSRSRASASASASATSSGGKHGKECTSSARASAEAKAGDRHETSYDEKFSSDEDGSCSASAGAKARAATDSRNKSEK
jgi:hypothetical protein